MQQEARSSGREPLKIYLLIVALSHTLNHVYVQAHLALIPVFMTDFGLDLMTVGWMVAIPLVVQGLMYLPAGMVTDRFDSYYLVAFSLALTASAAVMMSLAQNVSVIVVALSLLALSTTFFHPPSYTIVSELFPVAYRNRALGIQGGAGTFGFALGPISVGVLLTVIGWRMIYLVWAVPALLCIFVLLWLRLKVAKKRAPARFEVVKLSREGLRATFTLGFVMFLLAMGVKGIGSQSISTFTTPYLVRVRTMSPSLAGLILGLIPLSGIVAAPAGGFIADKLGEKRWLVVAFIGDLITVVGIALSETVQALIAALMLYGFFSYTSMAAASSLVAQYTPRSRRGMGYALYFLPSSLVGAVAPVLAAYIAEAWGIWQVFPFTAAIFALATVLIWFTPLAKART